MIDPKDTRMDEGLDEAEAVDFAMQFESGCRDCADRAPHDVCPSHGMPCEPDVRRAVMRHTVRAISYGIANGYLNRSTIGGEPVAWETPAEWELEQAVFSAANHRDVPEWARKTIGELWKQYCLVAHPAPTAGEGVKVNALEWEEVSSRIFDAKGVCGLYRVKRYDDHWAAYLFGSAFNAERSTADEAKAAAQADYEARIRSALAHPSIGDSEAGAESSLRNVQGSGWKLVPVEPTEAMRAAAMDWLMSGADLYVNEHGQVVVETTTPKDVWKFMLDASPEVSP
jgi:hypothetical protein